MILRVGSMSGISWNSPLQQAGLRRISSISSFRNDWNSHHDFFRYTRGRFVINEQQEMAVRHINFDMNELAKLAAHSIDAGECVNVEKFADGMFNKAFLFAMGDGTQVVGKVPNPNAGLPHYTTASEVATMDFVRFPEFLSYSRV